MREERWESAWQSEERWESARGSAPVVELSVLWLDEQLVNAGLHGTHERGHQHERMRLPTERSARLRLHFGALPTTTTTNLVKGARDSRLEWVVPHPPRMGSLFEKGEQLNSAAKKKHAEFAASCGRPSMLHRRC